MCDFGLAKRYDVESSIRKQTGMALPTTPSQRRDPEANIDHRAEIYALVVMIYQMITGHEIHSSPFHLHLRPPCPRKESLRLLAAGGEGWAGDRLCKR